MNLDINHIISNVAIALIAMSIAGVIKMLFALAISRRMALKGSVIHISRRIFPTLRNAALYLVCFWFFISQLRALIELPGPPMRMDTLLIAFWTWWLVWLFTELVAGKPFFPAPKAD